MAANEQNKVWKKSGQCLYRYIPTGDYFARVRFGGKLFRGKLNATDYNLAGRKLVEFRNDLSRTDATKGNTSFATVLDGYSATLGGADTTKADKRVIIRETETNVVRHRHVAPAHNQTFASHGVVVETLRRAGRELLPPRADGVSRGA